MNETNPTFNSPIHTLPQGAPVSAGPEEDLPQGVSPKGLPTGDRPALPTTPGEEAQPQTLPLHRLRHSPHNPRKTRDPEALHELAESILAHGLLQNLVAYPEGEAYEVPAGGSRLEALRLLEAEGKIPPDYPVRVLIKPKEQALEVALVENLQRTDMPPLEEAEGFARLLEAGRSVEEIALRVGKSVKTVQGRIALARTLIEPGKQLLAQGKIPLTVAVALAAMPADAQEEALKTHGERLTLEILKGLAGKGGIPRSRILFPLEEYLAAGGRVLEALLGGETVLLDVVLAHKLQHAAAEKILTAFAQQGMEARLEVSASFPYWDHRPARPGERGVTVVVMNPQTLEVRVHANLVHVKGAKASQAEPPQPGGAGEGDAADPPQGGVNPAHPAADPLRDVAGGSGRPVQPGTTAPGAEGHKPALTAQAEWAVLQTLATRRGLVNRGDLRLAMALVVQAAQSRTAGLRAGYALGNLVASIPERRGGVGYERKRALLKEHGEQVLQDAPTTLEGLLALEGGELERLFLKAVSLAVAGEAPFADALRVGDLDAEHLKGYPKAVLFAAAGELGLSVKPSESKEALVRALLSRPDAAVPEALRQAQKAG